MSLRANWSYPTAIKFGAGRIAELAEQCKAVGMTRPLLVTDKALATLPITAQALDILEAAGLGRAVFSDVDPNPNEHNMEAGIAVYKAGGHDGVVCFGGGSALDLGKMIALMAHQRADLSVWDLEDVDDWYTRADASRIAFSDCGDLAAGDADAACAIFRGANSSNFIRDSFYGAVGDFYRCCTSRADT